LTTGGAKVAKSKNEGIFLSSSNKSGEMQFLTAGALSLLHPADLTGTAKPRAILDDMDSHDSSIV
jgi:hypothetical protein